MLKVCIVPIEQLLIRALFWRRYSIFRWHLISPQAKPNCLLLRDPAVRPELDRHRPELQAAISRMSLALLSVAENSASPC
jgi:hypothetical protein